MHIYKILLIFFLLSFHSSLLCYANEEESFDKKLERDSKKVSEQINSITQKIDHFLSGSKESHSNKKTSIVFENSFVLQEKMDPTYKPNLKVNIRLPNLEEKVKLSFDTYDEDGRERGINKNRFKTTDEEERYGISISWMDYFGGIKTSFRPRLELDGEAIRTSYILSFKKVITKSLFSFLPNLQFFARSDTGTGMFLGLNTQFTISDKMIFTIINEGQYVQLDHLVNVTNGLSLKYTYNETMNQLYSFNYESNNKPAYHMQKYTLASSFHHALYQNVLEYFITPYLLFDRVNHFSLIQGIEFKLHLIY